MFLLGIWFFNDLSLCISVSVYFTYQVVLTKPEENIRSIKLEWQEVWAPMHWGPNSDPLEQRQELSASESSIHPKSWLSSWGVCTIRTLRLIAFDGGVTSEESEDNILAPAMGWASRSTLHNPGSVPAFSGRAEGGESSKLVPARGFFTPHQRSHTNYFISAPVTQRGHVFGLIHLLIFVAWGMGIRS